MRYRSSVRLDSRRMWAAASVVCLLVAALVVLERPVGAAQLPPGGTFTDDNGNIHEPNIEAIAAAGITNGCNPPANDRYCPADSVSRAEMAAFLLRAIGEELNLPTYQGFFADVPAGQWYTPFVERLFQLGITTGYSDGTYKPATVVTRAEMSALLLRALGESGNLPEYKGLFSDVPAEAWYRPWVERMYELGITSGCGVSPLRYCPDAPVARDEMASFLARALGLAPIVPPTPTTTTSTTTTTLPTTTTTFWLPPPGGSQFWSCSSFGGWSCSGNTDPIDFSSEYWSCSDFAGLSCSGNIDKTDFSSEYWSCSDFAGLSCSGNIDKRDFSSEYWSCTTFLGISCSGNIDKSDFSSEYWSCFEGVSGWSCSGDVDKSDFGTEYWTCDQFGTCSGDPGFLAPIVSPIPYFSGR